MDPGGEHDVSVEDATLNVQGLHISSYTIEYICCQFSGVHNVEEIDFKTGE